MYLFNYVIKLPTTALFKHVFPVSTHWLKFHTGVFGVHTLLTLCYMAAHILHMLRSTFELLKDFINKEPSLYISPIIFIN